MICGAKVTARSGTGQFAAKVGNTTCSGLFPPSSYSLSINGTIRVTGNVDSSVLTGTIIGAVADPSAVFINVNSSSNLTQSASFNYTDPAGAGVLAINFNFVWDTDGNLDANATGTVTPSALLSCVPNVLSFSIGTTGLGVNSFPITIGPFEPGIGGK